MHKVNQSRWNLRQTLGQALVAMFPRLLSDINEAPLNHALFRAGGCGSQNGIQYFRKRLFGSFISVPLAECRPLGSHHMLDVGRDRAPDATAAFRIDKPLKRKSSLSELHSRIMKFSTSVNWPQMTKMTNAKITA